MGARSETSPSMAKAIQRRAEAIKLRIAGATFEQIADKVGFNDKSAARKSVMAALRHLQSEIEYTTEEYRTLELVRIDELYLTSYRLAKSGDLQAMDRCIKLMELRAKYLGLFTQPETPPGAITINVVHDQK